MALTDIRAMSPDQMDDAVGQNKRRRSMPHFQRAAGHFQTPGSEKPRYRTHQELAAQKRDASQNIHWAWSRRTSEPRRLWCAWMRPLAPTPIYEIRQSKNYHAHDERPVQAGRHGVDRRKQADLEVEALDYHAAKEENSLSCT